MDDTRTTRSHSTRWFETKTSKGGKLKFRVTTRTTTTIRKIAAKEDLTLRRKFGVEEDEQ